MMMSSDKSADTISVIRQELALSGVEGSSVSQIMGLFLSGFLLSLSVCLDLGTVNVAIFRTGLQRGMWSE